ncbi:MAG: hypothetical protein MN733_28660 [Nitrososphaera sp.]|nr:hypothetical protein [Nitrososphaera sp.]
MILVCLCITVISVFRGSTETSNISPNSAATNLPSSTNLPEPTHTVEPEVTAALPGLSPVDVVLNLEDRKFTCTSVEEGALYYTRTCTREEPSIYYFQVVVWGREPFIVDLVETTVLQFATPDNQIAIPVMGFVATMPYDGATPEEARAWVEATIPTLSGEPGDAREMVFAGVRYRLFGPPTALTLEMGDLP